MNWTRHRTGALSALTRLGLYTIRRGGEKQRDYVLRFISIDPKTSPTPTVLGIHRREIDAQDEASRHHQAKESDHAKV